MNITRLSFLLLAFVCIFQNAWGHGIFKPAAIVGNEMITEADLKDRIAFIFLASDQTPPTHPASLNQVHSEILQLMVDEALKRQIAERFDLLPEEADVQAAIENIAQQNSKDPKSLKTFIESHGISFEVFRQHVIAELAWRHYLRERYSTAVRVSDQEIEDIRQRLEKGQSIPGLGGLNATLYTYGQVVFPIKEALSPEAIEQRIRQAESLKASARSLKSLKERSKTLEAVYTEKELISENEMPPAAVRLLKVLAPGKSTSPKYFPEIGVIFLFLKERQEVRGTVPEDDQIRRALTEQRLSRFSRKALEELSRSTFIEIRG